MTYLEFNEKKIYYEIKNSQSSKVLIFVHGSGGSSRNWINQFELDIEYDIIAFDLPSHGKSSEFTELSLKLYVQVIEKLIETLNYSEIVLCGHSLGGAIIQSYYFKNPDKLSKLILVGTGARLRVSPLIFNFLINDYEEFLKSLAIHAFSGKTHKKIISDYIKETSKIGPKVTFQDFSICDKFDTMSLTSTIKIPTLIIVGKEDKLTPVKYSKFFKEKINNSRLVIIENASHMVMLEKAEDFNNSLKEYLQY